VSIKSKCRLGNNWSALPQYIRKLSLPRSVPLASA
jgi:hypothetical protein